MPFLVLPKLPLFLALFVFALGLVSSLFAMLALLDHLISAIYPVVCEVATLVVFITNTGQVVRICQEVIIVRPDSVFEVILPRLDQVFSIKRLIRILAGSFLLLLAS